MTRRILIADDTKSWVILHSEIIKELYGNIFEITTAASAKEALNILNNSIDNPFILVISDLQMENDFEPKLAGEWLIENIKKSESLSRTKCVIISSMYNVEVIAENLGVDCISKQMLIRNKLLMKFMFEKIMPFLTNIK